MSENVAPAIPQPDTVDNAIATPDKHQPYDALGLKPDEHQGVGLRFAHNVVTTMMLRKYLTSIQTPRP